MAIFGVVQKNDHSSAFFDCIKASFGPTASIDQLCTSSVSLGGKALKSQEGVCAQSTDGRFVVAISGEILNKAELEKELANQESVTRSDAQLVAALFKRYGNETIKKINGQFCAAVWDGKEKELTLLLDRVGGIKSLYFTEIESGFIFSSSFSALLSVPHLKKEVSEQALNELFETGYVLPPHTLMSNISKVAPGEAVTFGIKNTRKTIVDRLSFTARSDKEGNPEALASKLETAVEKLTKEPETGFLLSGGIDSSVLVAMAAQRLGKQAQTFTAAFPGSPLDESPYAALVAKANNCPNKAIVLSSTRSLDELPEIVWHLGEPFLDDSVIPTFLLFRQIRQETSLIISGDAPDHLFGRYYPLAAKCYVAQRHRTSMKLLSLFPLDPIQKIWRTGKLPLADAYKRLYAVPALGENGQTVISSLLKTREGNYTSGHSYTDALLSHQPSTIDEFIEAVSTIDFYVDGSFGVFSKVGKMAAANDLVLREPYMDRAVSDYIAGLPRTSKIQGGLLNLLKNNARTKYLLKFGLGAQLLPEEIISKSKGGFIPPLSLWLKEFLASNKIHRKLCATVIENGYINAVAFEKIATEHCNGVRDWSTIIFMLISFDLWVRLFVENSFTTFPGWKLSDVYGAT